MKKLILAAAAAFVMSGSAFAQAPQLGEECIKYLSYYKEYYKQKNYNDALPNWRKAYQVCPPNARETVYTEGTTLIRQQIGKVKNNPSYKAALVDTLLTLHQKRAENYPKSRLTSMNNMATDVIQYYSGNSQKIFDVCSAVVNEYGSQAKSNVVFFTVKSAIDLYKDGKFETEKLLEIYETCSSAMEGMEQTEAVAKVKGDIESMFVGSGVADCNKMLAMFGKKYESNKNDIAFVTKMVKLLGSIEGCTDNDLYLNGVTSMYALDPSYTSAYYLYKLNIARGNYPAAVKYIEEAIAYPESDNIQDATYYYELAQVSLKNAKYSKAFASAEKSAALNPEMAGKAYLICGLVWGSQTCKDGTDIERRAPYWVAVDYLTKARNADSSLADECNNYIAQYRKFFPDNGDAFMYGLRDGDSYTVKCNGLSAVTTVRTQK